MFYRIVIFIIIISAISFKNVLANCDFKHFEYLDELNDPSSLKSISIDVNKKRKFYKNFSRIIVSKSQNIPLELKKNFKANITVNYKFGQCRYKANIRQLGDWKDHIKVVNGQPHRSLKVNLKEGNILNAVKFKLFIPETRESYNEILGGIILRKFGFLVPETLEVNLILNNSISKMIFQEDTTKEFLERNYRREGPIFEGDESLLWSYNNKDNFELENISLSRLTNYKWFLKGESSEYIVLKAFDKLQKSYLNYTSNFPKSKLLILPNNKKNQLFQDYYFILTSMNGWHALRPHNRKFYYNSFIDEFEPIYYDGMFNLDSPLWIDLINNDLEIFGKNYFFSDIKLLNDINFKKNILNDFEKRVLNFDKKLDVFFVNSIENIIDNSKKIHQLINTNSIDDIKNNDNQKKLDDYILKVKENNINQKNIISLIKNKKNYDAYLENNQKMTLTTDELSSILRNNKLSNNRYVVLNTSDLTNQKILYSSKFNLNNSTEGQIIYSKGIFYDINEANKIINIKQDDPSDWIFFKNIDFTNWSINFDGKINNPVDKNISQRFNTNGLTGCLNFFKSLFDNTSIIMNDGGCEDSVNIIDSNGSIKSVYIKNAFSDGLDLDFSTLSIDSLFVINAGNDCFDVSGGQYNIILADLSRCNDKALSIGEISEFNATKVIVSISDIGISVKDFSRSSIFNYKASSVNVCAEALQKKQEFGGAIANFKNLKCDGVFNQDLNSLINKDYNEF